MHSYLRRTWIVTVYLVALLSHAASMQQVRVGEAVPLPDGTPLQGEQFPRFLTPTHDDEFGFQDLLVLGDHPVLQFERRELDQESGVSIETWSRDSTTELAGRVVSAFRLAWSADLLRDALRTQRCGVDRPLLLWGDLVVPGVGPTGRQQLYLQMAPPNVPSSRVSRASRTVQYTSHAVNIWMPEFGQSRIQGGDGALDLAAVTKRFYDMFVDEFETLALVSQTTLLTNAAGLRRHVRNAVTGIGLELFDTTADYGSASVLQGIEVYPPGGWVTAQATLHQQTHQWGDYTRVWDRVGIARQGNGPESHEPLLSPGAFVAGAVLEGTRRVSGASSIERTVPTVTFHPLTLYRMGLLDVTQLPQLRVFVDQGQFDPTDRAAPPIGTSVGGGDIAVVGSDFVVADGPRTGPVDLAP